MKKALLITAASLFVIGQAFAQTQQQPTPVNPSSKQNSESGTPRAPNANTAAAKPDQPVAKERTASNRSTSKGNSSQGMGHHMKRDHMGRHHHRHRHSMRGMHSDKQQQGWGSGPQQGWQHPWGWDQNGKCMNNKRRDGSWCM